MKRGAVIMPAGKRGFVALYPKTGTMMQGEMIEETAADRRETALPYLVGYPKLAFAAFRSLFVPIN